MDDKTGCRKNREIPEKTVFPDNERPEPVVAGHAPVPTSFFSRRIPPTGGFRKKRCFHSVSQPGSDGIFPTGFFRIFR